MDFLPLHTNSNISEGNALRMDWRDVLPPSDRVKVLGNPPFVGARLMTKAQKADVSKLFAGWKNNGNLDYVACWYKQVADYMAGTTCRAALVSTNSITQGDAVAILWEPLFTKQDVHIDFAYRTFRWDNEAADQAHVHCVIVGFSTTPHAEPRRLFTGGQERAVSNINAYLMEAEDVFVSSRSRPLCDVPEIGIGNKPIDGGFYLFTAEEKASFLQAEPAAAKYFKPWYGSREFLHNAPRYCLWLGWCSPAELRKLPKCRERVEAVRNFRLQSKSPGTVKLADTPTHFHVENMPQGHFIVIPKVSSEKRRYVPMGYMDDSVLVSDLVFAMPDATLYHFGILESNVHMAWMRMVAGRLEMRYRYSKDVVYNNFPWPTPTEAQRAEIARTAQGILDARALYPDSSLADLYDDVLMPREIREAHRANDRAVMRAYGFDLKMTESACVAALMQRYQELVAALAS